MSRSEARIAGDRLLAAHPSEDPFAAAIEATRMPMRITDPTRPDNPIVICSDGFLEPTGDGRDEVVGRNCRFLQGPDTDPARIEEIRRAVAAEAPARIDILNHRKDGTPFRNALDLGTVEDDHGRTICFFAPQRDVTDVRTREVGLAAARDQREREREVHLLDGPTGVEVARHLSSKRVPMVFMTASPSRIPEDIAGAIGAIEKPYTTNGPRNARTHVVERLHGEPPPTVPASPTVSPTVA